jgi:hypothetical protein
MAVEHPLTKVSIEEFIQEHAIELYKTEKQRKAYRKSLWIFLPVATLSIPAYFLAEAFMPEGTAFVLLLPLFALLGSLGIYFNYNNTEFRNSYKKLILPAFFKSYYPQLKFLHLLGNPQKIYIKDQEDHRKYIISPIEDHIVGKVGKLGIEIFEAEVSGSRTGQHYEERSLVIQIEHAAPTVLASYQEKMDVQKHIQLLHRKFQAYPQFIAANDGNLYLIITLHQKYLEAPLKDKVYNQERLQSTLEEIHMLISLVQLLEKHWQEYS